MNKRTCACGERSVELGYDSCRQCLVDMVLADPVQLECFFDKPEILKWISEVHAERNRVLGRALTPGFLSSKQIGGL